MAKYVCTHEWNGDTPFGPPLNPTELSVCALVSLKAALGIFFFGIRKDREPDPMD